MSSTVSLPPTVATERLGRPARRRWPQWAGYAAVAWSAVYGALGVHWATDGKGFPFGVGYDPWAHLSVLAGARPSVAAPVVATLGVIGTGVGIAMARGCTVQARGFGTRRYSGEHAAGKLAAGRQSARDRTPGRRLSRLGRTALLTLAWSFAAGLTLVIPDARVLAVAGYAPLLVLGPLFGRDSGELVAQALAWPMVNQFICIGGGFLWAVAAVAYRRCTIGACTYCGRTDHSAGWTTPRAAARWGRWAVAVAVAVPPLYAMTRLPWAFGIPFGGHAAELRTVRALERGRVLVAPLALGCAALAGSLLTLGLVRPWGERFPRWFPIAHGRRVPPLMAIVPATLVSALVLTAGLGIVRLWVLGRFVVEADSWLGSVPMLLWPLWGVALALATLAYHLRRPGPCARCGRA